MEENVIYLANPERDSYDGEISGNILVLGSSASGKTTLIQEMASNSMVGKLKSAILNEKVSKQREAELDYCFKPKLEFCYP